MRPLVVLAAATLVACGRTEQPPADAQTSTPADSPAAPATLSLADVAGTWEGTTRPIDRDTVLTTLELTATATTDGWSMRLPNGATPAVRVLTVAGDSIVTESGPFASATRADQNVQRVLSVFRLRDGRLVGTTHATWQNGDTATLRIEMTKKG